MVALFRMDASYRPSSSLLHFDSLVWTERYQDPGDFQLVIENDISVLDLFPLGALLSHTDTREVMIVENHEFERDSKKNIKVTISGRSFETFAENRALLATTFASQPATTVANTLLSTYLESGSASADNTVPNLSIYTDLRETDDSMQHDVKSGDLYSRVIELLRISDVGLMNIRPLGSETTLDLVIHDGEDLTNVVIFYAQYEDLEDAKYFWSVKGYKNYTLTQYNDEASSRIYRHRKILTNLTGLDRRLMFVDANDIIGAYSPPTASDPVSARSQAELDENRIVSLIQAKISSSAKPKFKIHYDVGDLVTVFGEFGIAETMRVTEHVLTMDKTGRRGYPSLTIL